VQPAVVDDDLVDVLEQQARFGEDVALLGLLAETLLQLDRAAEALPWLEKACSAEPEANELSLMRGRALSRVKGSGESL